MNHARHSEGAFETVIEATLQANGWVGQPAEGFDRACNLSGRGNGFHPIDPAQGIGCDRSPARRKDGRPDPDRPDQMDGSGGLSGDIAARLQMLWEDIARGVFQGHPCAQSRARGTVRRQLRRRHATTAFSKTSEKSLDVTLSVAGIPVASVELENPMTGKTVDNALR